MAKDIDVTAKDAMEVAEEYLEEDIDDDGSAPVVVGKLDDEYVEVVEEEEKEEVVATDDACEVEKSVNDDVVVSESPSATPISKMEATPQAAIEHPQGTTVIGNQDTSDEWDTGS